MEGSTSFPSPVGGAARPSTTPDSLEGGAESIRDLIQQKENELHDIHDFRSRTLETLVQQREVELQTVTDKYGKLKQDFSYNLGLIAERDAELQRYDVAFTDLRTALTDRDAQLGEAGAAVSQLEGEIAQVFCLFAAIASVHLCRSIVHFCTDEKIVLAGPRTIGGDISRGDGPCA